MARTAHHTPVHLRDSDRDNPGRRWLLPRRDRNEPVTEHTTVTLRYPATQQDRTDQRPVPQKVFRHVATYSTERRDYARQLSEAFHAQERAERARVRAQLRAAVAAGQHWRDSIAEHGIARDCDSTEDAAFVIAPTTHRRTASRHTI